MAQIRICGVNIRIERDPNAGLYYIYLEYRGEKELPISLGNSIQPEAIYGVIMSFLEEHKIKCKFEFIKQGIVRLFQNTFKEIGIEHEQTVDLKFIRFRRTRRM